MDNQESGLTAILEGAKRVEGGFEYSIPPVWKQGRTVYGGLTSGLSLHAAMQSFDGLAPLRSAQINFIGPVTSAPFFKARLLRQGRNVTSICVEGYCEDKLIAHCVFIFAVSRKSEITKDFPAFDLTPPEDALPFFPQEAKAFTPNFMNNFDTRLLEGSLPMSAAAEPDMRVWSRMRDESSRAGIISFLTIGDVLPPAAAPLMTQFAPISSVNWAINFTSEDLTTREGWWQVESKLTAAENGYSSQIMRYWNTEGQLVAEATQLVTIFI